MTNWKEYKLGELCTITSSKRIFYKEYVSEGVPFFRSKEIIEKANGNDISTELFITKDKFQEIKDKFGVPLAGDILLTSVGTLGVSYQVQESDYFYFKDGNLTWFKDFSDEINTKFLLYWLRSPLGKEGFNSITIGSTQAALTIAGLKGIKLSIPDLPTQTAIAEILSSLDDKIELNNQINKDLEALAQALFKQWFIDFEFPNENGEPYRSSGGEMVDSDLGEIPKGWMWDKIGNYISFIKGKKPKDVFEYQQNNTLPQILINTLDTGNSLYANSEKMVISDETDLIMVMDGASSGRIEMGFSGIVGSTLAVIKVKTLPNSFLYQFLKIKEKDIRGNTTGAAIPHTDKSKILDYDFNVPSSTILLSFDLLFKDIREKVNINKMENQKLINLRDTLLPKLISGELEVSDIQTNTL